jgi:hypothetical protein
MCTCKFTVCTLHLRTEKNENDVRVFRIFRGKIIGEMIVKDYNKNDNKFDNIKITAKITT